MLLLGWQRRKGRRKSRSTLLLIAAVSAQESNHFFCGSTWDDASNNCDSRQHCPSGTDDECNGGGGAAATSATTQTTWTAATTWTAPSEWNRHHQYQRQRSLQGTAIVSGGESGGTTTPLICFGGTLCDSTLGHGSKAKYTNVPYEDISNTRFCGTDWNMAIAECSVETHCPTGFSDECPTGSSCYGGLACNVQDFIQEEDSTTAVLREEEEEGKKLTKLLTRMIHVGPTIVVKIGLMQALHAILNIGVQMLMTHYVHLA